MKKNKKSLVAAFFAAVSTLMICSCGSKIQMPQKIELVRPEKPTDAKYFEYKLDKNNNISIIGIKLIDMINDDVYENILVPSTIEGIAVKSATINFDVEGKHVSDVSDFAEKGIDAKMQKKALHDNHSIYAFYYMPQRLEFEEGIESVGLKAPGAYTVTYNDGKDKSLYEFEFSADINVFKDTTFKTAFNENKIADTFGLREIVFPDSVKSISGDKISGIALEKVKFPANLKRINCEIYGLYYNKPEVIYPKTEFVVTGHLFTCFKADEFTIPDEITQIVDTYKNISDFDCTDIKKLILPKSLNVYSPTFDSSYYTYFKAEEIVIPDNGTLTTRRPPRTNKVSQGGFTGEGWKDVTVPEEFQLYHASQHLKKFTLGKNATMDLFDFSNAKELSEFNIGEGAKINFDYATKAGYNPNYFWGCTKLPISAQQKLKEMGYKGQF